MVKSLKAELMKIEVESEIFSKIPDYRIGVAIILGIVNSGEINRKPEISTGALEQIAVWDEAAKKLGIKTSDFPQANKSLAKRHAKSGLPKINPVIDLANIYSLETCFPVGVHDLAATGESIDVRFGKEGDTYTPLNQTVTQRVTDPLVYATGQTVMTRNWTWRLSDTTKVTPDTHDISLFVDALGNVTNERVAEVTKILAKEITDRFGGKISGMGVLDKENNMLDFEK